MVNNIKRVNHVVDIKRDDVPLVLVVNMTTGVQLKGAENLGMVPTFVISETHRTMPRMRTKQNP